MCLDFAGADRVAFAMPTSAPVDEDCVADSTLLEFIRPSPRSKGGRLQKAIDDNEKCAICDEPFEGCAPADLTAQLGAQQIAHKPCYNGAHSLKRLVEKLSESNPEIAAIFAKLRAEDRSRWKGICGLLTTCTVRSVEQRLWNQCNCCSMTCVFARLVFASSFRPLWPQSLCR